MKNIMVIDDDPDIRDLLKTRLEKNGYKVETAEDGLTAIALLHDSRPDLIILDVMMPHMDGYSLLQELKYDLKLKGVPVLVLTARKDLNDIFEHIGDVGFIEKPFNPRKLLSAVKGSLR